MGNFIFITGAISLIAGTGLMLFAFKILKPYITTEKGKISYHLWLAKQGKRSKLLAFALIFFGIIGVIRNNPDTKPTMKAFTINREWTNEDKEKLTNQCVQMYISQEQIAENDKDLAENYCSCTTEKMTENFSINDLLAHDTLSKTEKVELYEPIVQNCIYDLEYQLNRRYNIEPK